MSRFVDEDAATLILPSELTANTPALDTVSPATQFRYDVDVFVSPPRAANRFPAAGAPTTVNATADTPVPGTPALPAIYTDRHVPAGIAVEYPPVPLRVSNTRPAVATNNPADPVEASA